jgi:hypothetical protein
MRRIGARGSQAPARRSIPFCVEGVGDRIDTQSRPTRLFRVAQPTGREERDARLVPDVIEAQDLAVPAETQLPALGVGPHDQSQPMSVIGQCPELAEVDGAFGDVVLSKSKGHASWTRLTKLRLERTYPTHILVDRGFCWMSHWRC